VKSNADPTPIKPKNERRVDPEDEIRRRAYELYEQRGKIDGYALDDWLQAEAEVVVTKKRNRAA
jgi:Protein of unknown function (DUF2934)